MVLKGKRVMDDKKLFRISDVAKMFQVSAGTLRHYEQAGLLHPEYTDPETSVFLGKVGIGITLEHLLEGKLDTYDLVFLILDEEDSYQWTTEELQDQMYVTIRFCGGHTEAPGYYRKILAYISAEHLTITGFSQEITMIDDGITSDSEKFVTEIRIPVDEK